MDFGGGKLGIENYPARYYEEFLEYVQTNYEDQYWDAMPKDIARFWSEHFSKKSDWFKAFQFVGKCGQFMNRV